MGGSCGAVQDRRENTIDPTNITQSSLPRRNVNVLPVEVLQEYASPVSIFSDLCNGQRILWRVSRAWNAERPRVADHPSVQVRRSGGRFPDRFRLACLAPYLFLARSTTTVIVPNMVVGDCSRCRRLYTTYCRCRRLYTGTRVGLALLLAVPYSTTTVNAFNGFVGRVPSTAVSPSSPTLGFDAQHLEGWR